MEMINESTHVTVTHLVYHHISKRIINNSVRNAALMMAWASSWITVSMNLFAALPSYKIPSEAEDT